MIFDCKILPVQNDLFSSTNRKERKKTNRKSEKEKSNETQTDGVIVSLSTNTGQSRKTH